MKVLVAVKQVLDYQVVVRVRPDQSGVDLQGAKMSLNPFDEIAVEEAVRLKEQGIATEVVAVSCGSAACVPVLRTALGMGADRAILVDVEGTSDQATPSAPPASVLSADDLPPLAVARLLQAICEKEKDSLGLVLMGKQTTDGDSAQVGPMLAALLDWPQATFASQLAWLENEKRWQVKRPTDTGEETLRLARPAVVTVDLCLNEPRYLSLPNIMKAKKKPLETFQIEDLNVDRQVVQNLSNALQTVRVSEPPARAAGVVVPDVASLVDKLRNEAKVI